MEDVLARFSPATAEWFRESFSAPTSAQVGAWQAISEGRHTLVVAPTGSGKTLAAFLWALDRLGAEPPGACRVVYVSPLRALAADVERNLRVPLAGIGREAARRGLPQPQVRVGVRTSDTPAEERRSFAKNPPGILITTPESLFLILTSAAREGLRGVETVIVDEIHAVAGTKRGAHLAVSLERLDELLPKPAQRIGLSATVRPVGEVARFLAGGRDVAVVAPEAHKAWQLDVVVPVPDMGDIDAPPGDPERATIWPHVEERILDLILAHRSTLVFANSRRLAERLTARINELWWERGGSGPPELGGGGFERRYQPNRDGPDTPGTTLARAHHGSVSREQRRATEEDLKSGRLRAVVATSSLELGIDMGAIDLVIQVESPPSVASGLQRIGRAGHHVGAVSRGVLFPKFPGDLVQTAVVAERMRAGAIEALRVPANPLDVLAQQIVAMVAMDAWTVDDVATVIRRAAPFVGLTRGVLESVLDMLAGRYASEEFAGLQPRLVWDRTTGDLTPRRSAQRVAVTSGGTIPDRGLFGVFVADAEGPGRRVGELDEEMVYESRVGDVFALGTSTWRIERITHDRVLVSPAPGLAARLPFWHGDMLGRPVELGRAVGAFVREVSEADEAAARQRLSAAGLDDWAADNVLSYLREEREALGRLPHDRQLIVERSRDELGDWRVVVLSPYGAQVHAPWALLASARLRAHFGVDVRALHADDGMVFRLPELGDDWDEAGFDDDALLDALFPDPGEVRGAVLEQLGASALFAARFRECAGRALLLPKRHPGQRQALWQQRLRAAQLLEVAGGQPQFPIVLEAVRECMDDVFDVPALVELLRCVRSREITTVLATPARASPFAASLLFGYVAQYLYEGDAPLAERRAAALSLDTALLAELLGTSAGLAVADLLDPDEVARTQAELQRLAPSRRARDPDELTDVLRELGPLTGAELAARASDAAAVPGWLAELETAGRVFRLRTVGLVSSPQPEAVGSGTFLPGGGRPDSTRTADALAPNLGTDPDGVHWAAIEDAGRLRDALGVVLPPGVPEVFARAPDDPLGDLLLRYARAHAPFAAGDVAAWLGIGVAVARDGLRRLAAAGRLLEVDHDPVVGPRFADQRVLATLRRRSMAALRHAVEPVAPADYARFLPAWHEFGRRSGSDGVARTIEQLAGVALPASAWETLVLPARVPGYTPALLDDLLASGEVIWQGHAPIGSADGWISLHLADLAPETLAFARMSPGMLAPGASPPAAHRALEVPSASRSSGMLAPGASSSADRAPGTAPADPLTASVLNRLRTGGAQFFRGLADELCRSSPEWSDPQAHDPATGAHPTDPRNTGAHPTDDQLVDALWQLVWAGAVTNDTFAPVRALLATGTAAHRAKRPPQVRGRYGHRLRRPLVPVAPTSPRASGRWVALPAPETDATRRAVAWSDLLLDRYGVVTRGAVVAEDLPGGFAGVYGVLSAAEDQGRVRRGYFVAGLGAAQFAESGVVDRLRSFASGSAGTGAPLVETAAIKPAHFASAGAGPALVLAASDPANPYGAAIPWPPRASGHLPGRKAGALVVLVGGELTLYVERGARTVLTWASDEQPLTRAASALADAVGRGALAGLTIEKVDGEPVFTSSHCLLAALTDAGFRLTPRGLRLRP